MSEKKLYRSRCIENFNPPDLIEKLEHKVRESVADAFLGQIEYGKDYIINTELVKEDWADGFGTKCTYSLKFDELVRCRDCEHYDSKRYGCWWFAHAERQPDYSWADEPSDVDPDGFCSWGVRRVSE